MEEENKVLQYPAPQPEKKSGNAGVAVGLLMCGAAIILFPHAIAMSSTLALIIELVGFFVLLIGILGGCVELDNWRKQR